MSGRTCFVVAARAGLVAAMAALISVVPADAGTRRCAVAELPWSFELPGGDRHGPSTLRLCHERAYSPSTAIHVVHVDGDAVGMLMSRNGLSEGRGDDAPSLWFEHDGESRFRLVAYAWPGRDTMRTYRLYVAETDREELRAGPRELGPAAGLSLVIVPARRG